MRDRCDGCNGLQHKDDHVAYLVTFQKTHRNICNSCIEEAVKEATRIEAGATKLFPYEVRDKEC